MLGCAVAARARAVRAEVDASDQGAVFAWRCGRVCRALVVAVTFSRRKPLLSRRQQPARRSQRAASLCGFTLGCGASSGEQERVAIIDKASEVCRCGATIVPELLREASTSEAFPQGDENVVCRWDSD